MSICGTCNSHTTRVRLTMTDERGNLLPEYKRKDRCPNCCPEDFHTPYDPIARVWAEHNAKPYLYETMPDGSLRLKDEPTKDLWDEWCRDRDLEEAIAKKRANRRTTPMSEAEIQKAEAQWTPVIQQLEQDTREAIKGDERYTEQLIEKLLKDEHASNAIN